MTKAEREHLGRIAELGCALCRHKGWGETPAEIHHLRTGTGAGRKASHFEAIPLCPAHHRLGTSGSSGPAQIALHVLGRKAWERQHGVTEGELLAATLALVGKKPGTGPG